MALTDGGAAVRDLLLQGRIICNAITADIRQVGRADTTSDVTRTSQSRCLL